MVRRSMPRSEDEETGRELRLKLLLLAVALILVAGYASLLTSMGDFIGERVAAFLHSGSLPVAAAAALAVLVGAAAILPFLRRRRGNADAAPAAAVELAGREAFLQALDRQIAAHVRASRQLALHLLDIDRFHAVNAALGEGQGDALLKRIAERLLIIVDQPDRLARIGDDEFAVIQPETSGARHAEIFARRLEEALKEVCAQTPRHVRPSVSFGLAIAPEHGTDAAALIHSASLALRSAKESGGGAVRIYGRELEMATQSRRQVEQAIGDGLANDWFELHYQPQYDLGTRRLIGFEALMRLRHPELGLMLPSTFVPVAEESGLIQPLGERLVKEALATAATCPSHVSLSICVAAGQFRHGGVAAGILTALAHAKVEGTRLRVKVPEAVLLAPTERSGEQLHRLRAAKVAVAIDGFGRHASNLKSLAEGICGTAILDGTVVAGIGRSTGEETFVRRLIDAARAFGLDVQAEGVERAEQAHFLVLHGCLKVQGLLFGAPVAATEIAAVIAKDVRNAVAGGVSLRSISAA